MLKYQTMKIAIACDHAGYEYKEKLVEYLRTQGYEVKDFGTHSAESMDYPKPESLTGASRFAVAATACA